MIATETNNDFVSARTLYRSLYERRSKLQEQKAHCELDLKKATIHPEFYDEQKIALLRQNYHAVNAELDRVTRQEASRLADNPELREWLEREFFGNRNGHSAETEEQEDET